MTTAMGLIVHLATEAVNRKKSTEELRVLLSERAEAIDQGARDTLSLARREPAMSCVWFDMAKSIAIRSLRMQLRVARSGAKVDWFIAPTAEPDELEEFLRGHERIAIVNFFLDVNGILSAFVASSVDGISITAHEIVGKEEATGFKQYLETYAKSVAARRLNFTLLNQLLGFIGSRLIRVLCKRGLPRHVIFIPHRLLHLVPLHAIWMPGPKGTLYLDNVAGRVSYASCLQALLDGAQQPEFGSDPRVLVSIDSLATDLSWLKVEQTFFQGLGSHRKVDFVSDIEADIPRLSEYEYMSISGHASSSVTSWGGESHDACGSASHRPLDCREMAARQHAYRRSGELRDGG